MSNDTTTAARDAFDRMSWADAVALYSAAADDRSVAADDLERLAIASFLAGRPDDSIAAWARAHVEAVRTGDVARGVRCAVWLGMTMIQRGDVAPGSGWLARAERLVSDTDYDGVERSYLLIPRAVGALAAGDPGQALPLFDQAIEAAGRFRDADLMVLGRLGRGQSLIDMADSDAGLVLLDEVMAAVMAGEVAPIIAGIAYCSVIETCDRIFDVRRAQQWTEALDRWTLAQPDLVPYRGQCLVYRAKLMRLHGAWQDAFDAADQARDWLSRPPPDDGVGEALYVLADLERLRGDYASAEKTYGEASAWGRTTEPGLALLRLAQGRKETAANSLNRALAETHDDMIRTRLLEAQVEVLLAAGDVPAARHAADGLRQVADSFDALILQAMADAAEGAVRSAEGDAVGALGILRTAWETWRDLGAPYEAGRVRVNLGRVCLALGDVDGATQAFDGARATFVTLGAEPDRIRLDTRSGQTQRASMAGLSTRELEVLRLVASGMTNREIAADLTISERTVDRHVSNIFTKLDVATRAAATAYAYEHELV